METKQTGNFQASIHQVDFESIYQSDLKTYEGIINDYYREKESINGNWNYGIDQYDNCLRSKWYEEKYFDEDRRQYPVDFSFDTWDTMTVPSCWNMQKDELFLYEGSIVYTRTFNYKNREEDRVFIKFGAVNYEAKVFINKKFSGMHKGGSTPFYIEVTGMLQDDNRILVVANNTRKRTNIPCENTDWFNYGGIYRDVEIIRLPETFIQNCKIQLETDDQFNRISCCVTVDGREKDGIAFIEIKELKINTQVEIKNGIGSVVIEAAVELWSPEMPKLYNINIRYLNDELTEKVGFRQIEVKGKDIYLNGNKIFLKGICAHEESVINGKAVTEEEIRENFRLAKELNCNYMRLAHYPHTEKATRVADEMGIMLWEEIPVYWAIDFANAETYKDAENQLCELIIRDRNRASVIIWSVGNENADTDSRLGFMSALAKKAKEMDSTRLISAACLVDHTNLIITDRLCEYIDIISINEYYGWYEPDFSKLIKIFNNSKPSKPVIISEFGADGKAFARGTSDDLYTEDGQLDVYRKQIKTLGEIPYIRGTSPWILFDFRCPRRLHSMQDYYNLKGLLSKDKTHKKLSFFAMQEFYKNL